MPPPWNALWTSTPSRYCGENFERLHIALIDLPNPEILNFNSQIRNLKTLNRKP
jgi:hypothetical protein